MLLSPRPHLPFILPLLFFSHSASLLNSALTSALPKTTTKESRSLAVPGRSWALVPAELEVQPISQRAEGRPKFCFCCLTHGAWLPLCVLSRQGMCTCIVCFTLAHGLGSCHGTPRATLHMSALVLVLVWCWGSWDPGYRHPVSRVGSQPANIRLFTHMCAQARWLCLLCPVPRGLHT